MRFVDSGAAAAGQPPRPAVVLIHGFGAALEEWAPVIPTLVEAGYRVVALDLRGHGWSDRPDGDYSIPGQSQLVLALADRLGLTTFDLVGHSWGSAVSLDVALRAPERVTRIALFNGMFFEAQQPVVFSWARVPGLGELVYGVFYPERMDEKMAFSFYDPDRHATEDLVERLDALMDRPGTLAASLAGVRAMDYAPLEARLRDVRQPVLLLWGREDEVTPLEWGERLLHALPRARLEVLPRCGHIPMLEARALSNGHLLAFLDGEAGP